MDALHKWSDIESVNWLADYFRNAKGPMDGAIAAAAA